MAGRGPSPKATRQRQRDQARRDAETTTVVPDGELRGPELPKQGDPWPEQTRQWWSTWRSSPLSQRMTGTDWDFLLDTALLHAALWRGDTKVAGELRLRVAKFGATPEDRARLRLQIESPPGPAEPGSAAGKSSRYAHLRTGAAPDPPAKRAATKKTAKKTPVKSAATKKTAIKKAPTKKTVRRRPT